MSRVRYQLAKWKPYRKRAYDSIDGARKLSPSLIGLFGFSEEDIGNFCPSSKKKIPHLDKKQKMRILGSGLEILEISASAALYPSTIIADLDSVSELF